MSASTPMRVGLLVQAVDGHDREQLVDRPAVRQRLEHGEIAEVGIRQDGFQIRQFLGAFLEAPAGIADAGAGGPVQPLREGAEFKDSSPRLNICSACSRAVWAS